MSVTVVAAAATHVNTLAVSTVGAAVLVRDGHFLPSIVLSVALYLTLSMTMLVLQAHLPAPWLAREKLFMAAWAAMATDITTIENGDESPFHF